MIRPSRIESFTLLAIIPVFANGTIPLKDEIVGIWTTNTSKSIKAYCHPDLRSKIRQREICGHSEQREPQVEQVFDITPQSINGENYDVIFESDSCIELKTTGRLQLSISRGNSKDLYISRLACTEDHSLDYRFYIEI